MCGCASPGKFHSPQAERNFVASKICPCCWELGFMSCKPDAAELCRVNTALRFYDLEAAPDETGKYGTYYTCTKCVLGTDSHSQLLIDKNQLHTCS
jgi:hypothetical protein